MGTKCFIAVGVFSVELLAYQVCKLAQIALFIYMMQYWVEGMTSSGICKRETAFSFFHRILCDAPKNSRGKNLIIVVKVLQFGLEK